MKDGKALKDTCRLVGVVVGVAEEVPMMFLGLFWCFFKAKTALEAFFAPSADGVREEDEKACASSGKEKSRANRIIKRVIMMAIMTFLGK